MRDSRRLHKIGSGYAVFIPLKWFESHDIDPEKLKNVQMDMNRHIVIVNPKDLPKEYKKFSKDVDKKRRELK